MDKQLLDRAYRELFRRTPDENFASLDGVESFCREKRQHAREIWEPPCALRATPNAADTVRLSLDNGDSLRLNDWSFGQLCRLAGVAKETVNRLSPDTASRVLAETLPQGSKPLQLLTQGDTVRAIHGTSYTRLFDAELVQLVREDAIDFQPPQAALNGATGLYAGEQDLFLFLIDPLGWTEIGGEAFAPGFFVYNSEVGKRALGIQTFWFQAVCQNHLVWDAVEVVDFQRRHTAHVHDALTEMRGILRSLVAKRDHRRDAFAKVVANAMRTKLGDDGDEVLKALSQHGIQRSLANRALEIAREQGRLTIFSLVDALTRISGEMVYIGDRTEVDARVSQLLQLAA